MNLFSNDKNLIQKIINGVVFIWFIASVVICFSNIVNVLLEEKVYDETEFEAMYCAEKVDEMSDDLYTYDNCQKQYKKYELNNDRTFYEKKSLIFSIGQIIIVGGALVLLNKKDLKNKKTK